MATTEQPSETAADAAELRLAEIVLGDMRERPMSLDIGRRIDGYVALVLSEHSQEAPIADPRQVIEALIRIAAGVAVVTGKDASWFTSYAQGIYQEERRAREAAAGP